MSSTATDDRTRAVEAVRAIARAARLLERASDEVSLPHYRVLSAIASGDERASRIAERLALGKPTVSTAVDALCHRGLLVRAGQEGDQRVVTLRLTPEGRAVLERVETNMIGQMDELLARTPDGPRMMEALVWLGAAIEEVRAERAAERHQGPR